MMKNNILIPQRLSFFFILLHPRRAIRALRMFSGLKKDSVQKDQIIETLQRNEKGMKSEIEILSAQNSELKGDVEKLNHSISSLSETIRSQSEELKRLKDTDKRSEELMRQLSKAEQMKLNYEKKIRNLQAHIDNLKAENPSLSDIDDEPRTINMKSDNRNPHQPPAQFIEKISSSSNDTDWLMRAEY